MASFWKSSLRDKARNGTFLGMLAGLFIWQGANIYTFIIENFPSAWYYLGEWSLPIYLIVGFGLIGFIIDKY